MGTISLVTNMVFKSFRAKGKKNQNEVFNRHANDDTMMFEALSIQ